MLVLKNAWFWMSHFFKLSIFLFLFYKKFNNTFKHSNYPEQRMVDVIMSILSGYMICFFAFKRKNSPCSQRVYTIIAPLFDKKTHQVVTPTLI